jgi:hypothetical protein
MNNSIKYLEVQIVDLCNYMGIYEIYNKKNRILTRTKIKMTDKLKKIFKYYGFNFIYEVDEPHFDTKLVFIIDWDKNHFNRNSPYENVYDFDNNFLRCELLPLVEKLQDLTKIVWFAHD